VSATPQATGGGGTITFIEAKGATANGSTATFSVNITSTGAHDALFVGVFGANVSCTTSSPAVTDNKSGGSSTYVNDWAVNTNSGHNCVQLYHLLNATSGITSVTVNLGGTNHYGGAIVLHFSNSGTWTAIDQKSAMSTSTQGTPWKSKAVTTTQSGNQVLIGEMGAAVSHYVGGIQNAYAVTGSWNAAVALCSQSTSSPCLAASNGNLDAGNGSILGMAYQIVSGTQTAVQFTGTNNASTNTYKNYPGIVTFY
jgi:hypothetical protein